MEVRPDLDPARRAVLADWLTARGDPRGELLMLELLLEGPLPAQQRRELDRRASSLRGDLEQRWMLELAAQLSLTPAQLHAFMPGRWYAGLLLECSLCPSAELAAAEVAPVLLEWILDSEAAVALEVLELGELPAPRVLEQLATRSPMPHLRRLTLGDYREDIGPLSVLNGQLPELRELDLRGPGARLEGLELPSLERLHMHLRGDGRAQLEQFAAGSWPALERLSLRFDGRPQRGYGLYTEPDHAGLRAVLRGRATPVLRELELSSFWCEAELINTLARSALLPRLECLAFSDLESESSQVSRQLLEHASAFEHLRQLEFNLYALPSSRPHSPPAIDLLQRALPRLNLA